MFRACFVSVGHFTHRRASITLSAHQFPQVEFGAPNTPPASADGGWCQCDYILLCWLTRSHCFHRAHYRGRLAAPGRAPLRRTGAEEAARRLPWVCAHIDRCTAEAQVPRLKPSRAWRHRTSGLPVGVPGFLLTMITKTFRTYKSTSLRQETSLRDLEVAGVGCDSC
jgi:hypothetical protein